MTEESSSSSATESTPPTTPTAPSTTWALPAGIEDDIEQALIKTTIGAVAGGVMGLVLFKGGKGTRAASIATGIGASLGSTWERVKFRYEQQENK
eukprot:CAMPEP_0116139596 /NCGR_PEP_ID=MMETSP0329-20121206/13396_1 /TAXON_ID=697910 /ORGANISM="Pseudo-nitzschia arenysensis, Strain B593" /LENGTH=94 /DNA_ID=CAMNT_0003634649 /DNA_START=122 /DNA_END=406 /DNA_ORIENTATION=-